MKNTLFYITDRVQIETAGPSDGQSVASASFIINGKELLGSLEFCKHMEDKKVVSVVVKTYILCVPSGYEPIEFTELEKMMNEIRLAYKGISDILTGAFMNGFFNRTL